MDLSHIITELNIGRNNDILELCCKNTNGTFGNQLKEIGNYIGVDGDVVFIDKIRHKNSYGVVYFHVDSDDLKFQTKVFAKVFLVMGKTKMDIAKLYKIIDESLRVANEDGVIGIFDLEKGQMMKLQAYISQHYGHVEVTSKNLNEDKYDLIIKKKRVFVGKE